MRVGIIGPTNIDGTARAAGVDPTAVEQAARAAGRDLAVRGHDVVVVPDRGVALLAAEEYRRAGGQHLIGVIPHGGTSAQAATSCCEAHRNLCHATVEDLTWAGQHERICQLSDVLLCIGLSCGTLSEIAWTKWVGDTPVIIVKYLVSGIPPEMGAETDLRWVDSLEDAYRLLDGHTGVNRAGVGTPRSDSRSPGHLHSA